MADGDYQVKIEPNDTGAIAYGKYKTTERRSSMIKISGTTIEITRGDCRPFTITLTGEDVPKDGESVLFSVKKNSTSSKSLIKKNLTVQEGKVSVQIMNADTKELPFGDYEWDIRFPDMFGENEPYTPMKPALFRIAKVIGDV